MAIGWLGVILLAFAHFGLGSLASLFKKFRAINQFFYILSTIFVGFLLWLVVAVKHAAGGSHRFEEIRESEIAGNSRGFGNPKSPEIEEVRRLRA